MNGLALAGGVLGDAGVAASTRQPSSYAAWLPLAWFKQSGAVTQHSSAACGKAVTLLRLVRLNLMHRWGFRGGPQAGICPCPLAG